jgi:hypothetical protein
MDSNVTPGTTEVAAPPDAPRANTDEAGRCMACPHPSNTHDVIANRYCDATISHAFTRGCICRT